MNESKHEIPAPMLDAAFDKWFAASAGPLLSAQATDGTIAYTAWNAAIEAAGVAEMAAQIAELKAELAQYQTSKFHPDWSLLQTTQESLRESWARIRELEAELVRVREVLHEQTSYLEGRLRNAVTGEGCPHGCVRPSQCVDCIKERG